MNDDLDKLAGAQMARWGKPKKAIQPQRQRPQFASGTPISATSSICPSWVPRHLIDEWRRVERQKDEFAAAAHVRALKAKEASDGQ